MARVCSGCGSAPASHWQLWIEGILEEFAAGVEKNFRWLNRWWFPLSMRLGRVALRVFSAVLLALGFSRMVGDGRNHPNLRTRALWESAERLGVQMKEFRSFGKPGNLFTARYQNQELFFEGLPRPRGGKNALAWMDDKAEMRKRLSAEQVPVANGGMAWTFTQAQHLFSTLQTPCIIKPRWGSRSRHTTIDIVSHEDLRRGFFLAKKISPRVIIEEQIPGAVHRLLVIDGRFRAAARRDYPQVAGDGMHSVRELVQKENENPLRSAGIFHALPAQGDSEAELLLAEQKTAWDKIPAVGRVVRLGSKVNRAGGGTITELTSAIHADTRLLAGHVARVVGDPIIGIDIILSDISTSWRDQRCAVIELNSLPFLDLHTYPLYGEPVLVADAVWRSVFPSLDTATGAVLGAVGRTQS